MSRLHYFMRTEGGRCRATVLSSLQPHIAGVFSLVEAYEHPHRRTVQRAWLIDPANGRHLVPPLMEARIIWCRDGLMTVKGVEEDKLTRKQTAQAWLVEVVTGAGR